MAGTVQAARGRPDLLTRSSGKAFPLKMEMPKHQRPWQGREIAKELKPEGRKGHNHGASADTKKHGIVRFGLPRF
jgi:hypothetical protein